MVENFARVRVTKLLPGFLAFSLGACSARPFVPPPAARPDQDRKPTYTVTSRGAWLCPDGQQFVTWEGEDLLNFRHCSDGKTLQDPLRVPMKGDVTLAIAGDGTSLVVGGSGKYVDNKFRRTIFRYALPSGQLLGKLVVGLFGELQLSTDGKILATQTWNKAEVWNLDSGQLLLSLQPGAGRVASLSADGRWYAQTMGGWDGVEVWDTSKGVLIESLVKKKEVANVRFLGSTTRLAIACRPIENREVGVWDIPSCRQIVRLTHPEGNAYHLAGNNDGSRLGTGSMTPDGSYTGQLWSLPVGRSLCQTEWPPMDISDDGGRLLCDGQIPRRPQVAAGVFNAQGRFLYRLNHTARIWDFDLSPDGHFALTRQVDGQTHAWKLP